MGNIDMKEERRVSEDGHWYMYDGQMYMTQDTGHRIQAGEVQNFRVPYIADIHKPSSICP